MKKHTVVKNIYEASGFNSFQEAIDWIEDTLNIGSKDHYTVKFRGHDVPPISVKITTNEEYFIQNDLNTDEPIFKMDLVFTLDKDNTLEDFIRLKHEFFKHMKNIKGTYYDYDINAYVINYDTPEGSINLLDYHPKQG